MSSNPLPLSEAASAMELLGSVDILPSPASRGQATTNKSVDPNKSPANSSAQAQAQAPVSSTHSSPREVDSCSCLASGLISTIGGDLVHWQDTSENGMCAPYAMAVALCPDIDHPGELTKIARKIQRVVKGKQEPAAWGLSDVIKFSEEYKTSIVLVYFARSIDSSSSKIIRQWVGHKPVCVQAQAPPILIAANSEGNHLYGSTIRPKVNWSVIPRISEEVTRPSKNFAGETGSGVSQAQHHPAYSTTKAKSKQQFRADLEHAFTNSHECGILEENIL